MLIGTVSGVGINVNCLVDGNGMLIRRMMMNDIIILMMIVVMERYSEGGT